jgi:hypothetical protein
MTGEEVELTSLIGENDTTRSVPTLEDFNARMHHGDPPRWNVSPVAVASRLRSIPSGDLRIARGPAEVHLATKPDVILATNQAAFIDVQRLSDGMRRMRDDGLA